jgi:hypothetical protein
VYWVVKTISPAPTSQNAPSARVNGAVGRTHTGATPHNLTSRRSGDGPNMGAHGPHSLLAQFERHLRSLNRSASTIGGYLRSARLTQAFLATRGRTLENADRADLEAFMADQFARGLQASSVATRCKGLKIPYRWLEEEDELANPMARMRPPIVPSAHPRS